MDQPNLDHWEQLADFHGRGADHYYDVDALVAGTVQLGAEEAIALAIATNGTGVANLDVMHLQCHVGFDTIRLARDGARVTGVDFSATALRRLDELANRCAVTVSTVEADSRDLPHQLDDSFDLVYATIGVLGWISDLDAWMSGVARALRAGGALVLVELHPLLSMVESAEPLIINFPYSFDGGHEFSGVGSYANRDADITWTVVEYAHGLAEVVMGAQRAGLDLSYLEEHTSMPFDPRGDFDLGDDGRYRLRIGAGSPFDPAVVSPPMPVLYTFIARKS
jgi:SAM-dependent methyltransferase